MKPRMRIAGGVALVLTLGGCVPYSPGVVGGIVGGMVATEIVARRSEPPPLRVQAYWVDWDLLTRRALAPDDVRKSPMVSVAILDAQRARVFLDWLDPGSLRPMDRAPGAPESEDARLVIDVTTDGGTITYYASRDLLLSGDSRRGRPIDARFRDEVVCAATGRL